MHTNTRRHSFGDAVFFEGPLPIFRGDCYFKCMPSPKEREWIIHVPNFFNHLPKTLSKREKFQFPDFIPSQDKIFALLRKGPVTKISLSLKDRVRPHTALFVTLQNDC